MALNLSVWLKPHLESLKEAWLCWEKQRCASAQLPLKVVFCACEGPHIYGYSIGEVLGQRSRRRLVLGIIVIYRISIEGLQSAARLPVPLSQVRMIISVGPHTSDEPHSPRRLRIVLFFYWFVLVALSSVGFRTNILTKKPLIMSQTNGANGHAEDSKARKVYLFGHNLKRSCQYLAPYP